MLKRLFGVEINLFWERQIPHSGQGNGGFEGNEHYGMSVCASNLALYGLQVKYFGVIMSGKANIKTTKAGKVKKLKHPCQNISTASLKMRYTFWILLVTLFLAGIAMILHVETPVVWTFLYGVGGWAALTNNLGE